VRAAAAKILMALTTARLRNEPESDSRRDESISR
jgi:hypothetical protein